MNRAEATRLVLAHPFETLGLRRVSLEVHDFNPRARRTYDKVGFVQEGVRRDALRFDGGWSTRCSWPSWRTSGGSTTATRPCGHPQCSDQSAEVR